MRGRQLRRGGALRRASARCAARGRGGSRRATSARKRSSGCGSTCSWPRGPRPPRLPVSGHGPLASWVSVAAIRAAIPFGRAETAELRLREKAIAEAAGPSPEILYMKGEVRRELEVAGAGGAATLEDRERLVLRLYLVSGMTLLRSARRLGVPQQTVSRWLQKARDSVLADVGRARRRAAQASERRRDVDDPARGESARHQHLAPAGCALRAVRHE